MVTGGDGGSEPDFLPPHAGPAVRQDPTAVYSRIVVLWVLVAVAVAAGVAWAISRSLATLVDTAPPEDVQVGGWQVLVSPDLPPGPLVALALFGITLIALASVLLEVTAALLSISPRRRYLERLRHSSPAPESSETVRVTVLVPAHNEEYSLPKTLTALSRQTRPPDRVIVVADNCTDRTAAIAIEMGYEAFETVGNTHKKGGALNQALARILPTATVRDVILVMDADTSLAPTFLEVGAAKLDADAELAAVGGIFYGEDGVGVIGQFQRNEYARYSLQLKRRHGRVFVLTGTATMFRSQALLDVAAARGVFIPGEPGTVYDTAALTEDNELTLALKSVGATMMSPAECYVVTEVMPTWGDLWRQRQRWQRGALENIGAYGMTAATLRYWGQQFGIGYGTVALNSALLLMLITFVSLDRWIWFPLWAAIGLLFWAERVLTVWRGGWRARLLAALLLPELLYDVFLQVVFVNSLWSISTGRQARWGHVQHTADAT